MSDFMVKATYVAVGLILYSILLGIYKLLTAYTSSLAAKRNEQDKISTAMTETLTRMGGDIDAIRDLIMNGYASAGSVVKSLDDLTQAISAAGPDLRKISDNAFLIARGARDIGDGVTALRAVVYGGKRAEDFSNTINDDERVRRSEIEYDVQQLMIDHGLPQDEARKRVNDMYAGRRMG